MLSKGKAFNFYEPIACFGMSILLNKLFISKNTPFQDSRSDIDSQARYYNYCDENWQENKF